MRENSQVSSAVGNYAGGSRGGIVRIDSIGAAAVAVARQALIDYATEDSVGSYVEARAESERVVTHVFTANEPGYRGWYWSVTVMRAPRSKTVTVGEIALLPGQHALLAPEWVPWSERLRPGDMGVGDLLPTSADDERLAPTYMLSDDRAIAEMDYEFGLGRARVLSRLGRDETAERWYESESGPAAAVSRAAPARCGTCGFFNQLAGSLGAVFGACTNLYAPDDARVVSADHGCGAHSEAMIDDVVANEPQPV